MTNHSDLPENLKYAQGRLQPKMPFECIVDINDDTELEKECDVMDVRALADQKTFFVGRVSTHHLQSKE